jgi:hypothetical protein
MYYIFSVDHNGMVAHLAKGTVEGPMQKDGTDDNMLWNNSGEDRGARRE